MQDRFRLKLAEKLLDERVVADVSDIQVDLLPGQFVPTIDAMPDGCDRRQRIDAQAQVPVPPDQAVHNGNVITFFGQVESGSPSAIPVTSNHQNFLHRYALSFIIWPTPGRFAGVWHSFLCSLMNVPVPNHSEPGRGQPRSNLRLEQLQRIVSRSTLLTQTKQY